MKAATERQSIADQAKQLIADPLQRIEFDAFVNESLRRAIGALSLERFPAVGNPTNDEFAKRIASYEAAIRDIQTIMVLLARWGDRDQLLQIEKILCRLVEVDKGGAGTRLWLRLNWFPILALIYAGGIAAMSARRYEALHVLLATPVRANQAIAMSEERPVTVVSVRGISDIEDDFKRLPGHEKDRYPRSEYLHTILRPMLDDALFLGGSYEALFDRFEVFLALAYADFTNVKPQDHFWGPPGRFAWKHRHQESPVIRLMEEAQRSGSSWPPVAAGLFGGRPERFLEVANGYRSILDGGRY
jgi:hypothetical protein